MPLLLSLEGLVEPRVELPLARADSPEDVEPSMDVDGEMMAGVYVDVVRLPP